LFGQPGADGFDYVRSHVLPGVDKLTHDRRGICDSDTADQHSGAAACHPQHRTSGLAHPTDFGIGAGSGTRGHPHDYP
jgi:hypothetical protein